MNSRTKRKVFALFIIIIVVCFLGNSLLLKRSDTYSGHNDEQESVMASLDWTLAIPNSFKEIVPITGLQDRFVAKNAFHNAGIIDSKGNVILDHNYYDIKPVSIDGIFAASINIGKNVIRWGYINQLGEWLIEPTYRNAEMFAGNYAAVQTDDSWVVIDRLGTVVSNFDFLNYELISTDTEGIYIVKEGALAGIYNVVENKMLTPIGEYELYEPIAKREYVAEGDKYIINFAEGKYTITDTTGKVHASFDNSNYQLIGSFVGDYVVIRSFNNPDSNSAENFYGYMNYQGEVVVPPVFLGVSTPNGDFAVIQYNLTDYGIIQLP